MAKKIKNLDQYRDKTIDELGVTILDLETNVQDLKIKMGFGQVDNLKLRRNQRKDLARAKTVLKEKQAEK